MNPTMQILLGVLFSVLAGFEVPENPIAGYCGVVGGGLLLLEGLDHLLPK